MHNVLGLIFADSHYANISELTNIRPLGALPINGRYRSIDFCLSNLVILHPFFTCNKIYYCDDYNQNRQ